MKHLFVNRNLTGALPVIIISLGLTLFVNASSIMNFTIHQSVEENWRTSYDILVRPTGSEPFLDFEGERLIEPNFLSGQKGGITLAQYQTVAALAEVETAAPIAMLGYFPLDYMTSSKKEVMDVSSPLWSVYKNTRAITIRDNIQSFVASDTTYTVHNRRDSFGMDPLLGGGYFLTPDGKEYPLNDLLYPTSLSSTKVRLLGRELCLTKAGKPTSHSFGSTFDLFALIAGIDPSQEQQLVGLQDAIQVGRYLKEDDAPRQGKYEWVVPVLFNQHSYKDIQVTGETFSLKIPPGDDLAEELSAHGIAYLDSLETGEPLDAEDTSLLDSFGAYVAETIRVGGAIGGLDALSTIPRPTPIEYTVIDDGLGYALALEARPQGLSNVSPIPSVPLVPQEISFREKIEEAVVFRDPENSSSLMNISFRPIGSFLLDEEVTNPLNQAPMESYYLPSATYLFDEQRNPQTPVKLRPTNNPFGYLQDTPMAFVTLESAQFLSQREDFISAIRVRVKDVDLANEASQRKIERIADEIRQKTGLQVDLALGSSPQRVLVHVPGLGYIEELWIRQKVGIGLQREANLADLFLLVSFLFSSYTYAMNHGTNRALRRQNLLGVSAALGWKPVHIFNAILRENLFELALALILSGGVSGALIALGVVEFLPARLFLPAALLAALYLLAILSVTRNLMSASIPRLISGQRPVRSFRAPVRLLFVDWGNLLFTVLSLGMSAGVLIFVFVTSQQLQEGMRGSVLGEFTSLRIQPYQSILLGITLVVSGFCVLESFLFQFMKRKYEIGLLKAIGWNDSAIYRQIIKEGVSVALLSSALGAVVGACACWLFYAYPLSEVWGAILLGAALPVLVGLLASSYPAFLSKAVEPILNIQNQSME